MKKLFAIAIAASLAGGLYGFTFGLGAAYDNIGGPEGTDPYFSIKADVMVKPMPILGFRIGLVRFDLKGDEMGGTQWWVATGGEAGILIYIPMAAMIQPYIPIFFKYADGGDFGTTEMDIMAGLGAEMGFGTMTGYLEGKFVMYDLGETTVGGVLVNPDAETWFNVQGGVRIPIGM